jgi:hypothetical protein
VAVVVPSLLWLPEVEVVGASAVQAEQELPPVALVVCPLLQAMVPVVKGLLARLLFLPRAMPRMGVVLGPVQPIPRLPPPLVVARFVAAVGVVLGEAIPLLPPSSLEGPEGSLVGTLPEVVGKLVPMGRALPQVVLGVTLTRLVEEPEVAAVEPQ